MKSIGFVGLGVMGRAMAANLVKAGFPLTIFNRTVSRCAPLGDLGAVIADSPADAARRSEVVIMMVSDTAAVESLLYGADGVAAALDKRSIIVDMSTISPAAAMSFAADLHERGCDMLDAPVSGGEEGAKQGSLTIMVGGRRAAFEECLPVLQVMGKTITYTGPSGNGQKTKLVNQVIGALNLLATIEGLRLARASGLDVVGTLSAVSGGAASSWMLGNVPPKIEKGDYRPGFSIRLQEKDLRLARELAEESQVECPGLTLVQSLFSAAVRRGLENEASHGLIHLWEKSSLEQEMPDRLA